MNFQLRVNSLGRFSAKGKKTVTNPASRNRAVLNASNIQQKGGLLTPAVQRGFKRPDVCTLVFGASISIPAPP